ncbi:GTPase [Campylobacter subantarcticus]|uniref:GTP binding protein n=1 Tax=Campylobacter subantarcticus LMG 24374 TaxID=1388751 RepID=A0A0A8H7J0_9BACT|nr:GTPase [Campylobacter subantarcticus]AJC89942.1 GTP binding protein [Campylobacter subantarcticus LMG 24374]EAJ1260873.1 GTP-binding protein [Campylobacter lari]
MKNITEQYKSKIAILQNIESELVDHQICDQEKITHLKNTLQDKIENFKPKMMVYGVYNSGKSTLINALVGKEVAKTGDAPETKQVQSYKYNDFEIFDTPGVNAPEEDQKIADDYYKQCELILFVMSNENVEQTFLYEKIKKIIDDKKSAIIILNKKQNVSDEDDIKQREVIYLNLEKFGFDKEDAKEKISVYSVNALSAYKGKSENKNLLYENSGFYELENKIKDLFYSSGEKEIIQLCNKNINDFIDDVNISIDKKLDDKSIEIIENFISNTQREKEVAKHELLGIVNEKCSKLENELYDKSEGNISLLEDVIKQSIDEIKQKLENTMKEKVENLKKNIENINYTFDKLSKCGEIKFNTSNSDEDAGITDFLKNDAKKWLSGLELALIAIPHPYAKLALKCVAVLNTILSTVFSDNETESQNEKNKAKQMLIINEIKNIILRIKDNFTKAITEQLDDIYNPIIHNKSSEELNIKELNTKLLDIKNRIGELNQELPTA